MKKEKRNIYIYIYIELASNEQSILSKHGKTSQNFLTWPDPNLNYLTWSKSKLTRDSIHFFAGQSDPWPEPFFKTFLLVKK